jgi:hypothetical protein
MAGRIVRKRGHQKERSQCGRVTVRLVRDEAESFWYFGILVFFPWWGFTRSVRPLPEGIDHGFITGIFSSIIPSIGHARERY